MTPDVRIGTSGWHYKHWLGKFYKNDLPTKKMLPVYCHRFDTVEVNNSFYRLPSESALTTWYRSTPKEFCFAVKGSSFLTHRKKLKDPESALEKFLPRVELLAEKLGPILFQLPPRWHCNPERVEAFLSVLPKHHRYAFELRDPTWLVPEIYALLRRHNAAFCIYELAGFQSPREITADFTYIRLHGPGGAYQGSYSQEVLSTWARRIADWRRDGLRVYIYFDNDQEAFAAYNAEELRKQVSQAGS